MSQNTEHDTPGAVVGHHVRVLRGQRGLSLAELGARAGVSRTTVHDIERGESNPRLETLYAIATALSVGLADLIAEPEDRAAGWVVRAGEGPVVHGEAVDARLLGRIEVTGNVEVYAFAAREGLQRSVGHAGEVSECLVVHEGTITTGSSLAPVDLGPGDAALFDATGEHCYGSPDPAGGRGTLLVIHQAG